MGGVVNKSVNITIAQTNNTNIPIWSSTGKALNSTSGFSPVRKEHHNDNEKASTKKSV
ncbi:MAG: hypothetical protein LBL91_00250 [Lachnospiraceae bacterium]|jgi:hypothetical protein|nr:hypothetical protein [Lachnospiraceae bacterium]